MHCGKAASTALLALVILLQSASPAWSGTADRFAGYGPAVRDQAARVVAAAGPGNDAALEKEVRALRKLMYAQGILSINVIPDLIFERAVREGWRSGASASVRTVIPVSPLSASAWALLAKDDILAVRTDQLPRDVAGLAGAMRQFAPALLGCAAWVASYLSAAALWFVAWASIAVFLRARPSLEADLSRIVMVPLRDFIAAALAAALFLLPVLGGQGLAVAACFWMVVSAGYIRRGEFILVTAVFVVLATLVAGGGIIRSLDRAGQDMTREGWLAVEGYSPPERSAGSSAGSATPYRPSPSWVVTFAKARAAMIAGDPVGSERLWTGLIAVGKGLPEVHNNRGICLAMQGKTAECLSDFETALAKRPRDGPALWNAYQIYLQTFNLERARAVQPLAWYILRETSPFYFKPADMEAGEWVASALPASEWWGPILGSETGVAGDEDRGDFFLAFFRPLKPSGALLFLATAFVAGGIWKLLSTRIWVNATCRACGTSTLVAGTREPLDPCSLCRARVGGGARGGAERDRRVQGIGMHRRYVRACAILVPGSGTLWAGKEIRTFLFGIVLALSLAGISVSAGPGNGGAIVSELRHVTTSLAVAVSAAVWLAGAAWGVRSFGRFQESHNLSGGRR
ncbi:MAG: tetratricopeptide repeat protein [Verrucomicrobiota bacterium]